MQSLTTSMPRTLSHAQVFRCERLVVAGAEVRGRRCPSEGKAEALGLGGVVGSRSVLIGQPPATLALTPPHNHG